MFGRLLTPLKARFEVSPRPEATHNRIEDDENMFAENFARDVLIEIMRKSVDSLKEAEDLAAKIEAMGEIQRIMIEDACTKDVFRELDGYLLLINVLAILNVYLDMEGHNITEIEEGERLAFMLLGESLNGHLVNQVYFERHVGFDSIARAVEALVRDSRTLDQTLGFILSVALNNFALSSLFRTLRNAESTDFAEHKALLGTIIQPKLFALLITVLPPNDTFLRLAVFTLTEVLLSLNHRNQVLLSNTQLYDLLFQFYLESDVKMRSVLQKVLKRLLDVGVSVPDARRMFQHAVRDGKTLDADVIEIIRSGMKARWPSHFSLEGNSAFLVRDENVKGLPSTGFTFMIWLWVERLPTSTSQTIFKVWSASRALFRVALRLDGVLEITSSGNNEMAVLEHAKISRARWIHLTIVHHPHRASNPTIRVFIDGTLRDSRNWAYPRIESAPRTVNYEVGDSLTEKSSGMSWCIASAYLSSLPFLDDHPRLIQHLGPRYVGHFQAKELIRFLTYEAATSLNIFLTNLTAQRATRQTQAMIFAATGLSPLMRAIKDGLDIPEETFIFSFSPSSCEGDVDAEEDILDTGKYLKNAVANSSFSGRSRIDVLGDIVATTSEGLDLALWKLGGSRVALRLLELATTPHELSRTIGIFSDSVRMCWQMSEDMESTGAFELMGHILRTKGQLLNITAFETLFEFFGLNFRTPDHSVVMNSLAYRAMALDFEIWSSARPEIQRLFFEHFITLLKTSKYRNFNARQRLGKLGVVRKLLFVLQTDWYGQDMVDHIVEALKCVAQAYWSVTETIKPMVSYLASNLHDEDSALASSPRSILSRFDKAYPRARAERVFEALVSILFSASHFTKFVTALPFTRVCLLLLGDHPTPDIAVQVLTLIGLAMRSSPSFARKFELISGWTFLRIVLPRAWNSEVHNVSFDLLYGRIAETSQSQGNTSISCPQIMPAILAALDFGLTSIAQENFDEETLSVENFVEPLLEELMEQQSTSPTFRQLFKSKQTTGILISGYANFVNYGSTVEASRRNYVRILEKMNHLVLSLTLDSLVDAHQKQEILDLFRTSETLLSAESPDPSSVIQNQTDRKNSVDIQMLGEKAYQKTATKIREWRKNIRESEQKRLRRTALDLREYRRNGEATEWRNALHDDRGLWPIEKSLRKWALDETEGPCRVRKKLQRKYELAPDTVARDVSHMVTDPGGDVQSFVQVEAPPWAESYDLRGSDPDSEQHMLDDYSEDNLRRIRRDLHSGDVIEAVCTVTRIVGVDSSPGLLILGCNFLYMVDGLVENETGEVIDARDAPRNLFTVPGSQLELDGKHRVQSWSYDQITSFSKKTCLFRDVALELYFKDSRSLLVVFSNKRRRQDMSDKISHFIEVKNLAPARSPLMRRTPMLGKMSAKVLSNFRDELSTAQRKWQAREISNFTYLSILNQASGRTLGDATQYPVFPWILADYESDSLDLTKPSTFRDLSLPMGALTEARREAALQRYSNLLSVDEVPFHYGTHFSSSMIVCHFLIRLEPFTHMFKTLQGGDWDLPDRLFSDVSRSYHSASQDLRGDVRELIPEFFTCPEFLQNLSNLDFGVQQNTGKRIHDVKLPPWAKNDPLLFIVEHRRALECDFVSERLPEWIDLIWGCKQRDVQSLNVFHPFSYEGSINLDNIKDEVEREATVGIIHNFGQTPRKLFESPHPRRLMHGPTTLPLGTQFGVEEDAHLLVQSSRPLSELPNPIASLVIDTITERIIPCRSHILYVPQRPHEQVEWGFVDQSLKLILDRKVVQVVEPISCSCGIFVDSDIFITGSSDTMLRMWRLSRKDSSTTLAQTHMLRAHSANVVCVTACRAWSIIVSGSEDGTAIVWDLNRAVYVNTIDHRENDKDSTAVHCVAVNDSTGYIASCSSKKLCLHTVNAQPIVVLDLTLSHPSEGRITSLAFHEREYSRLGVLATGTNTGNITLRSWTTNGTPDGATATWKFVILRTLQCREGIDGRMPKVTALQFVGESLFHGEDSGKVYMWDLPE